MDFAVSADHWVKIKESEKIDKIFGFCQRAEKALEHEGDGDTNSSRRPWNEGWYAIKQIKQTKNLHSKAMIG